MAKQKGRDCKQQQPQSSHTQAIVMSPSNNNNSGSNKNNNSRHRRLAKLDALRHLWLLVVLVLVSCSTSCSSSDASACASCAGIPARFTRPHQQQLLRSRRDAGETDVQLIDEGAQSANPIPVEFYRELSNVTDFEEFFERFVDRASVDPQMGLEGFSENYKRSVERASAVVPRPANCMPENTIVPLMPFDPPKDPSIIFVPSCTRVKRCGGCCGPQLSCQPVETEIINFQILEYQYGARSPKGKQIVPVEQHTRCVCDCRIKPGDCNPYQEYDAKNCRCDCTNSDEKNKCNSLEHKIWDERECRCVCRDSHSCTTGTTFDESQCKCVNPNGAVEDAAVLRSGLLDRKRFIVKAVPVETDNSTVYDV